MRVDRIQATGDLIGGRYQILAYLNQGGMQEVYTARDTLLLRDVALKVPKNQSASKRFKRSAVVSARVNHSNVAKTLDYLEIDDRSYLVEELIGGIDLSRMIKERLYYLDPYLAAWTLHRLAKGVAASHHAGVIHRDLKPSNVMVEGAEAMTGIKVTDFGIAKMAEDELAEAIAGGEESLTASQTAIGALPYMAPEMIDDIKRVTTSVDIWSLGAMTYELLVGIKPFGSGLKAVSAIQSKDPLPISHPPSKKIQFKTAFDELMKIVLLCLNKDPSKRPTADALVSRCESICYPKITREFGQVSKFDNGFWGFINPEHGKSIFFHVDSVYSESALRVGDKVSFARHLGGGSDRAFPVMKVR